MTGGWLRRGRSRGVTASDDELFQLTGGAGAIHQLLDGLAGFYGSESDARAVLRDLETLQGLGPHQRTLLGPADAWWPRFVLRARRWNRRPLAPTGLPVARMGTGAVLGALIAVLLVGLSMRFVPALRTGPGELAIAAVAMLGAMVGAGLFGVWPGQQSQYVPFDRIVRSQLGAGCWAVLVHDMSWPRQAAVVKTISRRSQRWYGVTSGRHFR